MQNLISRFKLYVNKFVLSNIKHKTMTRNSMKKESLSKNIIYNIIRNCSSVVFPLITFPYISRILQPVNIGKLDFSNSIVSYFTLIAELGISTYAIRECASVRDNQEKLNKIASQIFSINVWSSLLSYLLLFLLLVFLTSLSGYKNLIIIYSSVIFFTTFGTEWINNAMSDFKYITIRTFCFQLLSLCLMFLFVKDADDYINYAIIAVVAKVGSSICNFFYRRRYVQIKFVFNVDLRKNLRPILVLFVMLLAQNIFNNADKTMLGFMSGDFDVGIYSTAVKITNILSQLVTSILWVIMPSMSLLFEKNNFDEINILLRKILSFYAVFGLPCLVGVISLSNEIIYLIAGPGYEQSSFVLSILSVALLFRFFGGGFIGNIIMLPMKKESIYLKACVISTVINIILNVFFIKFWGPVGAAITTAISELIIGVYLYPKLDKRISIQNIHKIFIAPILGSLVIIVICFFIKAIVASMFFRLFWGILIAVPVYFMILIFMKNDFALDYFNRIMSKKGIK